MRWKILVFIVLILAVWTRINWAQDPPPTPPWGISIVDLNDINIPANAFSFNPASNMLEGSGSDLFQVKITKTGAISGSVSITSVTCPITNQTAAGGAVGYLSAFLSRNDLILPSPSTTDVVLTVEIKVPLTVPAGAYTGGAVQITATANF